MKPELHIVLVADKRSSLLMLLIAAAGTGEEGLHHGQSRARSRLTLGSLVLWNYWGTIRFAPVPCSRPVAGPHTGTVPMGPLAAKHAGVGTGHDNGVQAPFSED